MSQLFYQHILRSSHWTDLSKIPSIHRILILGFPDSGIITQLADAYPNATIYAMTQTDHGMDAEIEHRNNILLFQRQHPHEPLPFPDNYFDYIQEYGFTLEYTQLQYTKVMMNLRRVLSLHGRLEMIERHWRLDNVDGDERLRVNAPHVHAINECLTRIGLAVGHIGPRMSQILPCVADSVGLIPLIDESTQLMVPLNGDVGFSASTSQPCRIIGSYLKQQYENELWSLKVLAVRLGGLDCHEFARAMQGWKLEVDQGRNVCKWLILVMEKGTVPTRTQRLKRWNQWLKSLFRRD